MINVQVRYFASLREALGSGETVQVNAGSNVAALRAGLIATSAAHAAALSRERSLRCAFDRRLCDETQLLREGAEVAFFPPVTGG